MRRLLLISVVASAAVALYRRAQEIAEDEERPLADVVTDLPRRLWRDIETIPDDLRAAAEEGAAAAQRSADRVDRPSLAMRAMSSRRSTSRFGSPLSRSSYPAPRGKSTLSPGRDAVHVIADRHDDARLARRLGARRDDQPRVRLGLVVDRLEQDESVQRLDPAGAAAETARSARACRPRAW